MKKILLFAMLTICASGLAVAAVNQQEFDRGLILMQEQINQIQSQIDLIRQMMEQEQLQNSTTLQSGTLEGIMMGGEMPRGADPAQLPEPQSAGAHLINRFCTQCHGLPTPDLHTDIGWPPVVNRMGARMEWLTRNNSKMGIFAPTAAELKSIIDYMQKHAIVFPGK